MNQKLRPTPASLLITDPVCDVYWCGQQSYEDIYQLMQQRVQWRLAQLADSADDPLRDELWFMEHEPVYTVGLRGQKRLNASQLAGLPYPVHTVDRGGDVTFHGPGQLIGYPLLNLAKLAMMPSQFVWTMTEMLIAWAQLQHWPAWHTDPARPGIYTESGQKIVSMGLRAKQRQGNHCIYHGFALNVAMDLTPFQQIDPCGFAGQSVADCTQYQNVAGEPLTPESVAKQLAPWFIAWLQKGKT